MLMRVRLILASASPRRRELLARAGYAFDVDPVGVDETPHPAEAAARYVERLAREKALAGAARHPGRIVVGADTTVVIDDEILGKPADAGEAASMIRRLSGRSHEVLTGVAVASGDDVRSLVATTIVWMEPWPEAELAAYIATLEPFDKAGAYAIQGVAGRFIPRIEGDEDTVVGLPVGMLADLLRTLPVRLREGDAAPYSDG
jgi:septum formation protein